MRVLIVEDERRLAENIARSLRESAGYAVDVALDGEDGLYMAQTNPYDLLVLDLMLPKIDGLTLLKRLRGDSGDVPVLVLTARDEKESIVALLNAGADDYVSKPFDLGELLAPLHIAVVAAETMVPQPRDLFREHVLGGKGLARSFVFITGPSATADMGPLVRGVHGPHRLHIIVLR